MWGSRDVYNGYELTDGMYPWMLSDKDKLLLDGVVYIVEDNMSIRDAAVNIGVSKSYLHKWIHTKLGGISVELRDCCMKQLQRNKKKFGSH